MPFYHAPIIHDKQIVTSTVMQSTASTVFVDVIGATLTTKDVGQPGKYSAWASLLLSNNANNAKAFFRALLNGNPLAGISEVSLRVKDLDVGYTLVSTFDNVELVAGDVLQLQYRTDIGTLTLVEYSILIDGIPATRVVQ